MVLRLLLVLIMVTCSRSGLAQEAPTPSFLSQGQTSLQNGNAEEAIPHLQAAVDTLKVSKEGARALYLLAVTHGQLHNREQSEKAYAALLKKGYFSLLSPRLQRVVKGKTNKQSTPRSRELATLIQGISDEDSAIKGQHLLDFALASSPDLPGLKAAMAAAETALENQAYFKAEKAAKVALRLSQQIEPLQKSTQHSLDIVVDRSMTESRRLRWAWAAGLLLLALSGLALFLSPLEKLKQADKRPIFFIVANLVFAMLLFVGLYAAGADPAENSPLTPPRMARFMGSMLFGSLLGITLILGFRHTRHGAIIATLLGGLGLGASLYLFAWSEDYLPAFFL